MPENVKDLRELSEKRKFKLEFLSEMLGTVPKQKEIYKDYIISKALKKLPEDAELTDEDIEEELLTVPGLSSSEEEKRSWTGFHSDEQGIFIYNYMIKGFLKAATEVCMAVSAIDKIPSYRKWIDLLVFVEPRKIRFLKSSDETSEYLKEPDGCLERPMRIIGPKGPRTALSRSDIISSGRVIEFYISILQNKKEITWPNIEQALDYGKFVGLGQWRGSGEYGRIKLVEAKSVD